MTNSFDVVFFTRALNGGGAERVVENLANSMARLGKRILLIHLFNNPLQYEIVFEQGVTVISLEDYIVGTTSVPVESKKKNVKLFLQELPKLAFRKLLQLTLRYVGKSKRIIKRMVVPPVTLAPDSIESDYESLKGALKLHLQYAKSLDSLLGQFLFNSKIIAVMEEATIVTWMSQFYKERPYISSLHTVESLYVSNVFGPENVYRANNLFFSSACKSASNVIFPSVGAVKDLKGMYAIDENKLSCIPNPIDFTRLKAQMSNDFFHEKLESTDAVFVSIARLDESKDHELLLSACKILRRKIPHFILYLVGAGPLKERIQNLVNEYGLSENVFLLGHLENPFPVLRKAKSLILTSKFESFALVLIEAMACGALPISVDCECGPREVLENGEYGLLIRSRDPVDVAAAMFDSIYNQELRDNILKNTPAWLEQYDLSLITDRWLSII